MKKLSLIIIAVCLAVAGFSQSSNLHFAGKVYPSAYNGKIQGFNAGVEVGAGVLSLNVLAQKIYASSEERGHTRMELQPRMYHCSCQQGIFYAFSYMMYDNKETSYGGLLGYKFKVAGPFGIEAFGGIQSNTSYEMDWAEFKTRARIGLGITLGK